MGFLAALALPPFAFILTLAGLGIRDRMAEDTGAKRRKRARQKVRARLRAADAYRQRGEVSAFFNEIDRVIRELLSARTGRSVKGMRMDELADELRARGVGADDVARVVAVLEECDRARFAPGSVAGDAAGLGRSLDHASELLDRIEKLSLRAEGEA